MVPDDVAGGYRATRHLLDHGPHRDHRWRAAHGSGWRTRLKGYRRALKEAGLAYDTSLVVDGDWTVTAGYDSTRRAVGVIGTPDCDLLPERQDCVLDGYSTTTLSSIRADLILAHYVTKHLQQGIESFQSFNTERRTIAGFEAMLWLRKGFGFSGAWPINDENDQLSDLFGLQEVNNHENRA